MMKRSLTAMALGLLVALALPLPGAAAKEQGAKLPKVPTWQPGDTMCYNLYAYQNEVLIRKEHLRFACLGIDPQGNYTFEYSVLTPVASTFVVMQAGIKPAQLTQPDFLLSLLQQRFAGFGVPVYILQYGFNPPMLMPVDQKSASPLPIDTIEANMDVTQDESVTVYGQTFNTTKYAYEDKGDSPGLKSVELWQSDDILVTGVVKYKQRVSVVVQGNKEGLPPNEDAPPKRLDYELSLRFYDQLPRGHQTASHIMAPVRDTLPFGEP